MVLLRKMYSCKEKDEVADEMADEVAKEVADEVAGEVDEMGRTW